MGAFQAPKLLILEVSIKVPVLLIWWIKTSISPTLHLRVCSGDIWFLCYKYCSGRYTHASEGKWHDVCMTTSKYMQVARGCTVHSAVLRVILRSTIFELTAVVRWLYHSLSYYCTSTSTSASSWPRRCMGRKLRYILHIFCCISYCMYWHSWSHTEGWSIQVPERFCICCSFPHTPCTTNVTGILHITRQSYAGNRFWTPY